MVEVGATTDGVTGLVDTTGATGMMIGWGLGWAGVKGLVGDVKVGGLGISWVLGLACCLGFLVVKPRGMVLKDMVLGFGVALC